jgi:hypothetical protein
MSRNPLSKSEGLLVLFQSAQGHCMTIELALSATCAFAMDFSFSFCDLHCGIDFFWPSLHPLVNVRLLAFHLQRWKEAC